MRLAAVLEEVRRAIASFDDNQDAIRYEATAVKLAVWAHAELVRIHLFEDGNGRISRLVMNLILVRVGLRPIVVEIPKQEYRECLNHYFRTDEISPLVDLMLGLW